MDTETHQDFDNTLSTFVTKFPNQMHYFYFKELFTHRECDNILDSFKHKCTSKGTIFGDGKIIKRVSDVTWIPKNITTQWIYDRMLAALKNSNDNIFNFSISSLQEQIQLGCYRGHENGKYNRHVDMGGENFCSCRKLSISVLLSDPTSYKGGDLIIRNMTAPRKKGSACVFASFTEHEVKDVTEGERYSLVLWVYGPPFR